MSMSKDGVGFGTESKLPDQTDNPETETPLSVTQHKTPTDPHVPDPNQGYPAGLGAQPPQGGLPGLAGFAQMQGFAPPQPQPPVETNPYIEAAETPPEPPHATEAYEPAMPEIAPEAFAAEIDEGAAMVSPVETAADPALVPELPTEPIEQTAPDEGLGVSAFLSPAEPPPVDMAALAPDALAPGAEDQFASEDVAALAPDALAPGAEDQFASEDVAALAPDALAPDAEDQFASEAAAVDELPQAEADFTPAPDVVPPPTVSEHAAAPQEPVEARSSSGELKTFDAHYDQHPEIPLGAFDGAGDADNPAAHAYLEDHEQGDADFLEDEMSPGNLALARRLPARKVAMVAGSLVGALVLGGAIAFAYKQSGDDVAASGQPPLIQADSRPVKVAPKQPGGKEFPHKNKLIYDRLLGEESPEVERVVARQEDVANDAAGSGTASAADVSSTASTPKQVALATDAQGATDAAPGGPRRVKTLVVRPDGTIMQPPQTESVNLGPATAALEKQPEAKVEPAKVPAAAPAIAVQPQQPVPTAPKQVAPKQVAPVQPQAAAPMPTPKPRGRAQPTRVASATPAATGSGYVVQVAARKSQTGALAAFADLQQRYPKLLSGYRPMIQRAELGSKGTWYRLRVGPMAQKTAAADLCKRLKSAGLRSCLVRPQ